MGWDVKLVGDEEQEVASVGYSFWMWFQVYDFYDLYDFLPSIFDCRWELNKSTRVCESSGILFVCIFDIDTYTLRIGSNF